MGVEVAKGDRIVAQTVTGARTGIVARVGEDYRGPYLLVDCINGRGSFLIHPKRVIGILRDGQHEEEANRTKPLLYSVEAGHLSEIKNTAELLLSRGSVSVQEMRVLGGALMNVVRFAESLEALRGPGQPYVHILERKETP